MFLYTSFTPPFARGIRLYCGFMSPRTPAVSNFFVEYQSILWSIKSCTRAIKLETEIAMFAGKLRSVNSQANNNVGNSTAPNLNHLKIKLETRCKQLPTSDFKRSKTADSAADGAFIRLATKGNSFFIKPTTRGISLHSFWDGFLGKVR
ncbi:MAG: hypothetical protein ACLQU3_09745 [Limisphaerales bacterium]